MTSTTISKLRQQVNETQSKLALSDENLKKCEVDNKKLIDKVESLHQELSLFKQREESLVGDDIINGIKMSGVY